MIRCNWNEWLTAEDAQPRRARPRLEQTVGVISAPGLDQMLRMCSLISWRTATSMLPFCVMTGAVWSGRLCHQTLNVIIVTGSPAVSAGWDRLNRNREP